MKDEVVRDACVMPVSYTHLDVYKRQEYDHANIELRTDVQGVQNVGIGVPGHFRPEDAEHGSSRQHKRQQRANKKEAEGADKRGEERCILHFFCIGRARENVKHLEKADVYKRQVSCCLR